MSVYGLPDASGTTILIVHDAASQAAVPADYAARWVELPDGTLEGATSADGGKTWVNPPEPPAPAAASVVDIVTFKMRFTPAELIAVRASPDATVKAFLAEVVDDPRTARVNLALPFVQGAVAYLAGEVDLGAGKLAQPLIQPARVPQILAPEPGA